MFSRARKLLSNGEQKKCPRRWVSVRRTQQTRALGGHRFRIHEGIQGFWRKEGIGSNVRKKRAAFPGAQAFTNEGGDILTIMHGAGLWPKIKAWWKTWKGRIANATPSGTSSSVVTHEIKNYVCTLKGNAALLRQRIRDPEQRAIVERIARVAEKLESFALQPNARAESFDENPLEAVSARVRAPVRLSELVRICIGTHFPTQAHKFVLDAPRGLPPVLGDANRLEQVFLNLFRNAMEAGAENLRIGFRSRRGLLEVTIEDDGKGCPPEILVRIFEPFYSTKGESAGRGMGLFIVNAILSDHRCQVTVRTKNASGGSAQGLVFTVVFPSMFALASKGPAPMNRFMTKRPISAA